MGLYAPTTGLKAGLFLNLLDNQELDSNAPRALPRFARAPTTGLKAGLFLNLLDNS